MSTASPTSFVLSPQARGGRGSRVLRAVVSAAWIVGAWLLHGAIWATVVWSNPDAPARRFGWWRLFVWSCVGSLFYAAATPLIVWLARRASLPDRRALLHLAVHATAALALHAGHNLTEWLVWPLMRYPPRPALPSFLWVNLPYDVLLYAGIVAGLQAWAFHQRWLEGRTHALELRAELVEARLETLRMQLEPHFLYNTLHAISELVYQDPARADRAITRLADLLRATVALGSRPVIRLEEELAVLRTYADVLRLRMGDRLQIEIDAAPAALGCGVPPMLLQPLVENAVRHGLRGRGSGRVRIAAAVADGTLTLEVSDDGAGFTTLPPREGVGLGNVRQRLAHLHGEAPDVRFEAGAGGGATVRLSLPARNA